MNSVHFVVAVCLIVHQFLVIAHNSTSSFNDNFVDYNDEEDDDVDPIRINGGQPVTEVVPYQVSLQIRRRSQNGTEWRHFCGGVIISKSHVLTAAHCLQNYQIQNMSIVAGTIYWRMGGYRYNIAAKDVHPQYSTKTPIVNDIGVLKVKPPFDFSKRTMGMISLGEGHRVRGHVPVRLTGWGSLTTTHTPGGMPQQLQMLDYETITNEQCQRRGFRVTSNEICALHSRGRGACVGDSGGPLTTRQSNPPQLVGIVSYGTPKCAQGKPDVYTRVSIFLPYINKVITTRIP